MQLGLTELQAKTYLTLTRTDKAEVKKIAKISNIARQDLYRILPALEKLGLVEQIIATPKLYKALPLNEGTTKLFQKITEEHTKLKDNLTLLIKNQEENPTGPMHDSDTEFVITSEKERLLSRLEKPIATAHNCEMMLPKNTLNFIIFNLYEAIETAASKNAKIQIITQKANLNPTTERKITKLTTYLNFEIKYNLTNEISIIILNQEEVNIGLTEGNEIPNLWTNNPQILKIAQTAFKTQWNNNQNNNNTTEKEEQ